MKLTSDLFADFLKCPTKCYIRSTRQAGTGNAYADWLREQNDGYRAEAGRRQMAELPEAEVSVTPAGTENLKTATWRLAVDLPVETETMASRLHAVERVPPQGRGKPAQIISVRFSLFNKLTKDDRLLAAFDALVLSEALGREISVGKIIHGDDHATSKIRVESLLGTVRQLTGKMSALLAGSSPPDLILNRHCGECEFRDGCRQKALEKDDLILLGGLTEKERKDYQSKGIFTVRQLSYTFRPRRRPKRFRDKKEKYHHSLRALAIRENKVYLVGEVDLKLDGTMVFLDVEGIPDRDFYYLIGVRIGTGDAAIQHSFWADSASDERTIWHQFVETLGTVENPVIIHYGSYETTFMKRMGERYGLPHPDSPAGKAVQSATNLLSFIFARVYIPTYTNGLKEIAAWLGYTYTEKDPSGARAIEWRQSWERSRDNGFRQRLIVYNREDCVALAVVVGALRSFAEHAQPAAASSGKLEVVRTDTMNDSRDSKWREFTSPVTELVAITNAAHWDYQRERVYFRSSRLRRRHKHKPPIPGNVWHVDKVVETSPPSACPKCNGKARHKGQPRSRTVQELIWGRSSLRRRVVRYFYQPCWCSRCKLLFGIEQNLMRRGKHRKHGRSLIAYIFYHAIEFYIPLQVIAQSVRRLFGLMLNTGTLAYFKRQLADYYGTTYRQILDRIVSGSLAHADETNANVKGKRAYVWVFTNMREVAYLYSDSREAAVSQATLGAFKGVLVSDFYAAYDGLSCAQQKCLIHLVRDLNGELLDHPFDDELKGIVKGFGVLVKTIIDAVDRHGLRRRFLHRYDILVRRFYRELVDVDYQSAAATACKERFQKNRDRLFTFLKHDEVPWNNNNAEHAIKAFARLRDLI